MNNQYMPKYVKVKKVTRSNGKSCFLEKDHINAVEDAILYEDATVGSMTEPAGTDLLTIIRHVADGSSSTECKIASISKNGSPLPISEQKNVDIIVPTKLSDLTEDSTHRTVTDTEKTSFTNKIESINLNGTDLTIDPATKKATGLVKSTLPIPDAISFTQMTSLEFCAAICDLDTCKVGVIYSGYSRITDAPCNGCEVTISVMKDESEIWGSHCKVLVLRMNSTNHMEKGWVTMYHNEEMKYGTNDCPWETELMVPVIRTPGTYTLECTVANGSVSYQWVAKS